MSQSGVHVEELYELPDMGCMPECAAPDDMYQLTSSSELERDYWYCAWECVDIIGSGPMLVGITFYYEYDDWSPECLVIEPVPELIAPCTPDA